MDGNDETEVLETPDEKVEELEPEEQEEESTEEGEEAPAEPEEGDEVVVSIGDEPAQEDEPPEAAAKWVRDLRKKHQETAKENRELRKELDALKAKPEAEPEQEEPRPQLANFNWDEDEYNAALDKWHEKRVEGAAKRAEAERKKQEEGAKAQAAWQATLETYGKRKSELKVSDFEDAEAAAQEILSVTQQGVIVSGADNPAVVVYALGKNPKKAKELAAITDPVKFAFAVAKLEKEMKVTPKRTAPLPESTVRGSAPVAGADATKERLLADARKTGDYSKVTEFNRKQAAKKSGA